jgi:hypothetical protein
MPREQLNALRVQYNLEEHIRKGQQVCPEIEGIRELMNKGKCPEFREDEHRIVWYKNRVYVPMDETLREEILAEGHDSKYCIHPGSTKTYANLKKIFWWRNMKADIAGHVAQCDICNRVKAEHHKPVGLLKTLDVSVWKWESISMDFIVGLPRTPKGNDSIWVIVDRLTKVAHFIAVRSYYRVKKLADLYVDNILRLHGAPRSIVSDHSTQYVSKFWKSLHKAIKTRLDYSTSYHP